jgi:hypothetical protein
MKAILIDVKNKTISMVEVDDKNVLKDWYRLMGCGMVEVAHYIDNHDSILVDEEGLLSLTGDTKFFTIEGGHQPFAGNGLVVGVDDEGEGVSPNVSVEEIQRKVKFHTLREVQRMAY